MTQSRQSQCRRALLGSAQRLVKFLEHGGVPDTTIAAEIVLLLRRGLVVFPKEIGQSFGHMLGDATKVFHGVCPSCGNDMPERECHCQNDILPLSEN